MVTRRYRALIVAGVVTLAVAGGHRSTWSRGSGVVPAPEALLTAQEAGPWQEHVLATLSPNVAVKTDALPFSLLVSDDARHVAYIARYREDELMQEAVVHDGRRGPPASFILRLALSPSGSRVAYLASPRDNVQAAYLIVGDRRDQVQFTEGRSDPHWLPVFSPDGQRVAYKVETQSGRHAIKVADLSDVPVGMNTEGKYEPLAAVAGPEFADVDGPQFSPDGRRLTYAAYDEGKWYVVVDGQKGPSFADAGTPVFSPDGETVAFRATSDSRAYFAVMGTTTGASFDWVGRVSFSPDSRRLAYGVRDGGQAWVHVGDERRPSKYVPEQVVFSADGLHTAYWAMEESGSRRSVVIDDVAGPRFDAVGYPIFDASARAGAYWARDGRRFLMVAGTSQSDKFDGVSWTRVFNADGSLLGFAALQGREVRWKVMRVGRD